MTTTMFIPSSDQQQQQQQQDPERYCLGCRHHSSYHQLITRDKWHKFGDLVKPGKIPWFCEFLHFDPETKEERVCGCNSFQPAQTGR